VCMCVCVCACVHACVRLCVRARVNPLARGDIGEVEEQAVGDEADEGAVGEDGARREHLHHRLPHPDVLRAAGVRGRGRA
jgi:hypothetical protein